MKKQKLFLFLLSQREPQRHSVLYISIVLLLLFGGGRNATMFIASHKMLWFRSSR